MIDDRSFYYTYRYSDTFLDTDIKLAEAESPIAHRKSPRLRRIPPQNWREIKVDLGVDSSLDVLLATSKGRTVIKEQSIWSDLKKPRNSVEVNSTSDWIPYRLAINSTNLLSTLGECSGTSFSESRNVWIYPFKALVAFESEIRQALREAESKASQSENHLSPSQQPRQNGDHSDVPEETPNQNQGDATDHVNGQGEGSSPNQEQDVDSGAPDVLKTRDELRCLLNFMDKDMHQIFEVQRQVVNHTLEEVAFEDLWLLFSPGGLVFSKDSWEEEDMCQAYQVLHVTGGRHIIDDRAHEVSRRGRNEREWDAESENEERARDNIQGSNSRMTPFVIDCFYIDCNGYTYGPKARRFSIAGYRGKRKIKTLEVYPGLVHPRYAEIHKSLVTRGLRFRELAPGKHQQHFGRTLRESKEISGVFANDNYVIHDEDVSSIFC